jgi:hypothetical protein
VCPEYPRPPAQVPVSTTGLPPGLTPSTPRVPGVSPVRTSVGADPHVIVVGAAAMAADDVDGAGGVDHHRRRISRSPRRAGRAARPGDTCGKRGRPTNDKRKSTRVCARTSFDGVLGGEGDMHTRPHTRTRTHARTQRSCRTQIGPNGARACASACARVRACVFARACVCELVRMRRYLPACFPPLRESDRDRE